MTEEERQKKTDEVIKSLQVMEHAFRVAGMNVALMGKAHLNVLVSLKKSLEGQTNAFDILEHFAFFGCSSYDGSNIFFCRTEEDASRLHNLVHQTMRMENCGFDQAINVILDEYGAKAAVMQVIEDQDYKGGPDGETTLH